MAALAEILGLYKPHRRGQRGQRTHNGVARELRKLHPHTAAVRAADGLPHRAFMRVRSIERFDARKLLHRLIHLVRRDCHAELRTGVRGEKSERLICGFIQHASFDTVRGECVDESLGGWQLVVRNYRDWFAHIIEIADGLLSGCLAQRSIVCDAPFMPMSRPVPNSGIARKKVKGREAWLVSHGTPPLVILF